MALNFDSALVEPDKIGKGFAPFVTKAGRCHLFLMEFEEYGDTENGRHILKCEVISHDHDDQIACVVWVRLNDPSPQHKDGGETALSILCEWAYAFGLLNEEILVTLKKENKPISIDFSDAIGRQCFANLTKKKDSEYIDARSPLHVNNPKAEKYPRNKGMLAKATRGELSNPSRVADNNGSNGSNGDSGKLEAVSVDDPFAGTT